jgi:pyrroline-5-carboxylate reductase
MAAAMARGWASADGGPEAMSFCDLDRERAEALAAEVGGSVGESLAELGRDADLVVLAVKPAALDDVARELSPPALLSLLAATPMAQIAEAFPGVPALRVMPNQPVEVRRGILIHPPPAGMSDELYEQVRGLLELLGEVIELDESRIDAAMAVMSCSPAYVADVAEALEEAGQREGLDPELARELVAETFAGTAELLRKRSPEEIRRAVAPPGGATEAGLEALLRRDVRAAFAEAVEASLERFR